ncbi:MAG: hypothetical protein ACO1OQ_08320 [Rufibacter sp.]
MAKRRVIWIILAGFSAMAGACEPEKLERGKEMAVEAERHKVKRITQEDMEARVLAAGDTITKLIEGAFMQLGEGQPKEQALFVSNPEKLPSVQAILERYHARLQRKTFEPAVDARQSLALVGIQEKKEGYAPSVKLEVAEQEFVFQQPIQVRRRNCASCEEPSMLDFTATELDNLRVFSAQGKPDGLQEGQVRGLWQIYFPRSKVIEQITLKTKVSRRGRGGFFGKPADTATSTR